MQVDDIAITHAGGSWLEDFEGPGPWLVNPTRGPSHTAAPAALRVELEVAPNPFNPTTQIRFNPPADTSGSIGVYDLRGELVREVHAGVFGAGKYTWDGRDATGSAVSSGVYLVRAESGGSVWTQKVALVK